MLETGQIIFRLLASAVLSGIIGLEREFKHKPAGLRTNILVGVGSTLITLTSVFVGGISNSNPIGIAPGVIIGIGFLGGGLIIRSRGEVHGITTAATIWIVAAVGLAVGVGFYSAALITTVISLVVLYLFSSEKLREKIKLNNDKQ